MSVPFKKESHRKERITGLIQQEISKIILREMNDPRCGLCTVTRVQLADDLKSAKVYVSVLGDESKQRTVMRGLQHARGFIQRRLFQEVKLRHTPTISFHLDHSIEESIKISQILREEGCSPALPTQGGGEQENGGAATADNLELNLSEDAGQETE